MELYKNLNYNSYLRNSHLALLRKGCNIRMESIKQTELTYINRTKIIYVINKSFIKTLICIKQGTHQLNYNALYLTLNDVRLKTDRVVKKY